MKTGIYSAITLITLAAIMLSGCVSADRKMIEKGRNLITSGKAECVLIAADRKITASEKGNGVNPLLFIYDTQRENMNGGIIVDKVIGRAAAAIAIAGRVKHVHAEVLSEDAALYLNKYGITSSHTLLVTRILNRNRDGLCPLEQSVDGITDPEKAIEALRRKIESFGRQ